MGWQCPSCHGGKVVKIFDHKTNLPITVFPWLALNSRPKRFVYSFNIMETHMINLLCVRPIHTQRIPANVKDVIIGDINGDDSLELVISLTDRVVRTYKWLPHSSNIMTTPPSTPVASSPNNSEIVPTPNRYEFS